MYSWKIFCIFLSILFLFGCATTKYVEVSDYFAVKQASGFLEGDYQELFARENKSDKFKLIGTTMPTNWDKPFSGPALEALEASLMALSSDGKTLLYWHQKKKLSQKKTEGIYRYRVGEGEKMLYQALELDQFWHRYDKPLPKQIMAIRGRACTMEKLCALNADDGSLSPLAMYGSTPLHLAAYHNDVVSAQAAVQQKVGIDDENYWGFTALEIAIKKGHGEIALLLLGQGADYRHKQKRYLTPIQLAVLLHRWRVLEALRHELDDPALLAYVFPRNYSQFISDDTKDFRQDDLPRLVRMMLDAGIDPTITSEPLIYQLLANFALRGSKVQLETLKLLLDRGAHADQPEPNRLRTPLHSMAGGGWRLDNGAREVLALLIANMGTLEARDKQGLTALQIAMLRPLLGDGFNKALYLIKAGADDSVEYLCGTMGTPSGISIRQKLAEWHGVLPEKYDCGAYR